MSMISRRNIRKIYRDEYLNSKKKFYIRSNIHVNKKNMDLETNSSPILEARIVDSKIQHNRNVDNNQLTSCCGRVLDKRLLVIVFSFMLSSLIIVFCMVQLIRESSCEANNTYIGIISLIIGIWIKIDI